ncbi:MAG: type V CRISPR-associated protein Cas4 [Candidatus Caenarcaniphilales bacterium]|nr:type V CRISPR-associated protein Cas4 [Candidatus Caenarcaniphilales bacterium]
MEVNIPISYLNDFIFCPRSIYYHQLYGNFETRLYQENDQIEGILAHEIIDEQRYSISKKILQGVDVYCSRYGIHGKIDTFDISKGLLTERKKKIVTLYDGYIFQVYAQYFALQEMGHKVSSLKLYSMDDNKNYYIKRPEDDPRRHFEFEQLIENMKNFCIDGENFYTNPNKCERCIYKNLCDYSKC